MVVWQMQDGVNWSVQARRWSAGWAGIDTLTTTGSVKPGPALSMADDGRAVVAMIGPGTPLTVGAMRWDGASWSHPTDLLASPAIINAAPGVGISRDGSALTALWSAGIAGSDRIQAAAGGSGGWNAPVDLSTPGTAYGFPRVSLSADGSKAAAVWGPAASSGPVQVVTRSQAAWSTPLTVDTNATMLPQVALSEDGASAVAAWSRADSTVASAWWNGNTWEPSTVLSDPATSAGLVRLAMGDDAVEAIAVWRTTSGSVQAARIAKPPSAPTGAAAAAADAAATVTWVAPSTDGGRPVTGYRVTASPGSATCTTSATSCTVAGLANGTAYTFTVVATNAVGDSEPSEPSAAVTPLAPVGPPITAEPQITVAPSAKPLTTTVTGWPRRIRTSKARVVVKVRIAPALGRQVLVQKKTKGWRTVRTTSLANSSQARLKVRLKVPGVYRLTVPRQAQPRLFGPASGGRHHWRQAVSGDPVLLPGLCQQMAVRGPGAS